MPIEKANSLEYYLIAFDAKGKEHKDDPDGLNGLMSKLVLKDLSDNPITDVFLMSHGWMGDVPAAKKQYNKWISAMAANQADINQIKQARPGFHPLLIGLHWPSKPFGDEKLGDDSVSFDTAAESPVEQIIDQYAERIADTEIARKALRTLFASAMDNIAPDELPSEVRQAYEVLNQEADLGYDGVGGAPGSDRQAFDPEAIFQAAAEQLEPVSFGIGDFFNQPIFESLRTISFGATKKRACQFGENGGFELLKALQQTADDNVRFHLMGHSFGCIVMSASLAGPNGLGTLVRPVNSLILVQGALSLWSYCSKIPKVKNRAGYFHSIIAEGKVAGPIITTQSEHDTAIGIFYALGSRLHSQIEYAPGELPQYGAVGEFGAQGTGLDIVEMKMRPFNESYSFESGKIYNLESSAFIRDENASLLKRNTVGAHSDFDKQEIAHAVWSAAIGVSII
jgi:hypothetical protein